MKFGEWLKRGLFAANDYPQGPMPGPMSPAWLSSTPGPSMGITSMPLVASQGDPVWTTFRNIYLSNPWVFSAVNTIARTISRMPADVMMTDKYGDPEKQRYDFPVTSGRRSGGQQLDYMLRFPAGGVSFQSLMQGTIVDRLVQGNSLWRILDAPPGSAYPEGFSRIRWRAVRDVHEGMDGLPASFLVARDQAHAAALGSGVETLYPEQVVHFGRGTDPELPVGVSPLASCRHTLMLHNAIMRSMVGWFGNSMKPSGMLKVDRLTRERAKEIRDMVQEAYSSPENAGQILVTSGDWQQISSDPGSSSVSELLQQSRQEVATAYQIPPPILGMVAAAMKAGIYELRDQFIRDCVGSWTAEFEADINVQMLQRIPAWQGLSVQFDLFSQLRPDFEALAVSVNDLGDTMSVDDRRELFRLKPFRKPWSTVPWSKPGSMPLDEVPAAAPPGTSAPTTPIPKPDSNGKQRQTVRRQDLTEAP